MKFFLLNRYDISEKDDAGFRSLIRLDARITDAVDVLKVEVDSKDGKPSTNESNRAIGDGYDSNAMSKIRCPKRWKGTKIRQEAVFRIKALLSVTADRPLNNSHQWFEEDKYPSPVMFLNDLCVQPPCRDLLHLDSEGRNFTISFGYPRNGPTFYLQSNVKMSHSYIVLNMDSFKRYTCAGIGCAYDWSILHSRSITDEFVPFKATAMINIINESY